jgi:uncharacterized coiled-coil protein SlyX
MKRETPIALADMRSKLAAQHNRITVLGIARRLSAHIEALEMEAARRQQQLDELKAKLEANDPNAWAYYNEGYDAGYRDGDYDATSKACRATCGGAKHAANCPWKTFAKAEASNG